MATSRNGDEVPTVVGMKVADAGEGLSLGEFMWQIEAGELYIVDAWS